MSKPDHTILYRQGTFKQFDMGQAVILNDAYLAENQHELQLQARVNKIIQEAREQAQQIVEDAQLQAQQTLQAAQEKAAKIVEEDGYQQRNAILNQGYQEGYEAGLENGIQEISRQIADKIHMGERMLDEALVAQKQVLAAQSAQILSLLDCLLKQILAHEISMSPDQLGALILQALERLHASGSAKIVMNPQMLQSLKDMSPDLQAALSAENRLHFVPDSRCPMEHIYLETVDYCYNISPQAQADVLLKTVAASLPSAPMLEVSEDPEPEAKTSESPMNMDEPEDIYFFSPTPEGMDSQNPSEDISATDNPMETEAEPSLTEGA